MTKSNLDKLSDFNKIGKLKTAGDRFIDVHCHCLFDIDDGPVTLHDSLDLCKALVEDGVTDVIATPHQLGRYGEFNDADKIRNIVTELNKELAGNNVNLNVLPGADVRVDERICRLIEADKILTLADNGRYILLELPHEIFINIEPLIVDLSSLDIQVIISHPERHRVIARKPEVLFGWLEKSAHLQITAASLLGDFGSTAQKAAWQLMSMGMVCLVATDSHDISGRRPRMKNAFDSIVAKLGEEIARLVCKENPLRILEGKDMLSARSVEIRRLISERVPSRF
jgi:protein-tyrosine phosphatase